MIAEYDYDPATQISTLLREYVWMNSENVAVIEGGNINYIRTDHIGRPVFATNEFGVKVWEASYLPFGGIHTSSGTNSELRFPGQWFQSEAGLHQNWMRDYDPTTGRYIQADPLGLVDGPSVYGYALQNPGRFTDFTGRHVDPRDKMGIPENSVPEVPDADKGVCGPEDEPEEPDTRVSANVRSHTCMIVPNSLVCRGAPGGGGGGFKSKSNTSKVTAATKAQRQEIKRLVTEHSKNVNKHNGLNQKQFDEFKNKVQAAGGSVRVDGTTGVRGSSAGVNHAQVQGFGTSVSSRHVWLQPGVK